MDVRITAGTATSLTVTTAVGVVDGYITVENPAGSGTSSATYTTSSAPTVGVSAAASEFVEVLVTDPL